MKQDLLAIGEVMAELRRGPDGGFAVGFAGDTFNTALYCKRELGVSGTVSYHSRLGRDPLSDDLLQLAERETIGIKSVVRDQQKQIGIYAVSTDRQGERTFSYWRENSAARLMFDDAGEAATLPDARIIYLSGITLAIINTKARAALIASLVERQRNCQSLIAFDSNYRPALWEDVETARKIIGQMWQIADIALPSIDDEMDLFGDVSEEAVISRFADREWKACAIKRGERGPLSPNLVQSQMPEFDPASKVVDTTAAGDSFNGGYLAAMLREEDEATCLERGHKLASRVVGYPGAIIPD